MPSQSLRRPHYVIIDLLCTSPCHLASINVIRGRVLRNQGTRRGATLTVESVQSSCLGRIARAGLFPVLSLDQSSPAKPTATRMIAVTIPRLEARSWSYAGLRHTRLQPQTRQSHEVERGLKDFACRAGRSGIGQHHV